MKDLYLQKAEENFPRIIETEIVIGERQEILKQGSSIVIDLGNHYVGYFSFKMDWVDVYIDAPVKLEIKFCETKRELDDDFSRYKGSLCSSWLQEEMINIDFPGEQRLPRRYAARYIQINVAAAPQALTLSNYKFTAVTSADISRIKEYPIQDEELARIDAVSTNTLKNCMQRVFEDGPKRDRRLWIGDLRLEALTNYYTFDNMDLVRRCLYLFAAADTTAEGFIPGYIYENPQYVSGEGVLVDYALLYVASVCDYYNNAKDKETFENLYPVIKQQMEAAHSSLDADGIIAAPEGCDVFIDWCQELQKTTAFHGVYLYVLRMLCNVLEEIGSDDEGVYIERLEEAQKAAARILFDKEQKIFLNEKDSFQYSVHAAVWMILGGVISGDEARRSLIEVLNSETSVKPFTPYMHHYVVEAMVNLEMYGEAREYIKNYWGGMLAHGADTFYEVYVPEDLDFSPYGDRMINSMCHAWSCTPAYFIRKYHTKL